MVNGNTSYWHFQLPTIKGIGRTGVLILMETAICIMESGEPVNPIKILEDMRRQRAMLIQTSSQFQFVADAICRVYDQKHYRKSKKSKRKWDPSMMALLHV